MPKSRAKSGTGKYVCDAAHSACLKTRHSTTGIVSFLNGAPIIWYFQWQNTIKSSIFGNEFVTLKIALEMNDGLRYKLQMMGSLIEGPTNCFCDNESVWKNMMILPEIYTE